MIRIRDEFGGKKAYLRHVMYNLFGYLGFLNQYRIPKISRKNRIVFVCSGNICRSAMAHHQLIKSADIEVASIGLDTIDGKPANERISRIALAYGVDLSIHHATSVSNFIVHDDDVFICMEAWQCAEIKRIAPSNKTSLLGLWLSRPRYYLHDPYASCDEYATYCTGLIYQAVQTLQSSLSDEENRLD